MSIHDEAARIAASDQARAQVEQTTASVCQLANLVADYYLQQRRKGVPRRLAARLTVEFQRLQFGVVVCDE